jgi:DNA-binding winged helix-turn-helix (wHTH) protein
MAHGDRSVDVFVRKLRSKLQAASAEWNYIHTHFGVGYRFAAERAGMVAVAVAVAPADSPAVDAAAPAPVPVAPVRGPHALVS